MRRELSWYQHHYHVYCCFSSARQRIFSYSDVVMSVGGIPKVGADKLVVHVSEESKEKKLI